MSAASARVRPLKSFGSSGLRCKTIASVSRCGTGTGFHNIPSARLKMAVVAPIPSVMVMIAVAANPGACRRVRRAYRRFARIIGLNTNGGGVSIQNNAIPSAYGAHFQTRMVGCVGWRAGFVRRGVRVREQEFLERQGSGRVGRGGNQAAGDQIAVG